MALSQDLVSQFAKLVDTPDKKNEGVTIKGTYKNIGGVEYVQLDGSDVLTPVESTVEAKTGERVQVLIKDHFATVTGNISSPAARSRDVKDLSDTVDEQGNTIQQIDNTIIQQGNSIIQMNSNINQQQTTINQHDVLINQQKDQIVSIGNTLILQGNNIEANHNNIIAQGNEIDSMNNTIIQQGDNINSMNNVITQHNNRINQNSNNITQQGNMIVQQGNRITEIDNAVQSQGNTIVAQGNTIDAHSTQLTTHNSQITILNSGFVIQDGVLTGLSAAVLDDLKTNTLNTGYAKIDFANIQMAAVVKLFSDSGIINDLVVESGSITGELVGVTLKGDLIEAGTLVADKLVIKGSDGLYYKLNTTGETVESEQTNENSLNGQVIAAHSVTANKIQVTDLVAFGATIGGFDITESSINSHLKDSVDSPFDGLYFGADGQMALGNNLNHIKYYKDENDNYILDVRLDKLYLGSSSQTADQQFQGMVEVSAESLTTVFKTSGGSNLLRNSVGYSDTDFWLHSGVIETYQNDEMSLSGSKFIIHGGGYIEQAYSTQPGTEYSIAFKYKHAAVGTSNAVKVTITGNGNTINVLNSSDEKNDWTSVSMTYVATTNSPHIKLECAEDDIFEITDLIISQGTNDVWSGYMDEVYGKSHKLDSNGLRLYSQSSNRSSNTTSTNYQLKDGSTVLAELSDQRVYSQNGEFDQGMKIGRLRTVLLDSNNIIEYI